MNIPPEVFVWMLGAILAAASVAIHLLVRILNRVGHIATSTAVYEAAMNLRVESLERHKEANRRETEWLRRHISQGSLSSGGAR